MVKAYDGAMMLLEVIVLLLKIGFYYLESLYRFFFPVDEKSVAGEIVLVSAGLELFTTIKSMPLVTAAGYALAAIYL